MSKKASLGTDFEIDIDVLMVTRLLVQANSGGGKSWCIRKLLEATHGKVQQIVLDVEGDFASLRREFDYVLAGKDGDIQAHPQHAELLARRILELHSDLIVDLYELKPWERIKFVKNFLESMVNAPKELWHPVLIVLDEAHLFCPEKDQAESKNAVIDIATRGRKRGFCLVAATQRLSKLHKDTAAECNNKLIGRTVLDIDLKRAADEMGITAKEAQQLRKLQPGEFNAFGPAIAEEVIKRKIGNVKTPHPKAGQGAQRHTPAATAKVKLALQKLADLPQEAEEEARDATSLRAKVKELERQLRERPKPGVDQEAMDRQIAAVKKDFERQMYAKLKSLSGDIKRTMADYITSKLEDKEFNPKVEMPPNLYPVHAKMVQMTARPAAPVVRKIPVVTENSELPQLGACERAILGFLSLHPLKSFSKQQVGALTGYKHSGGGFNNAVSRLKVSDFVYKNGDKLQITDQGAEWITENGTGQQHSLQDWINKLGACERAVFEMLMSDPSTVYTKQEIAECTNYQAGGGGFNNALSRLNTLGLITKQGDQIQLNPDIQL